MHRWLARLLPAIVLFGVLAWPASVLAQQVPTTVDPSSTSGLERNPPVFSWVVAIVAILVIMLIACVPSRKA